MKVFNSTLAAIGLAAFVFASCSDSNSDPAGGTAPVINPADLTSVKLVAQQIDNSNIANYKNSTANARKFFLTRAGATNFTTAMPTAPTKESFSKVLNLSGPADLTKQAYTISSGKDINFTGKKINGATIFVDGKCTMQYDETTQMSNTTIVLLSSATLKYNGTGDMIPSGCTVYCTNPRNVFSAKNDIKINGNFYADFRDKKSDGSKDLITGLGAIKETTPAEKDKSITPTQNITFGSGANVFINGSIRAINLQVEDGANVYAQENLFNNDNNGNATINGNLYIGGFIKTRTLDVNGYLKAVEAVKVTNAFNVHDGANVEASYINVTNNTKDGDKVIAKGEATLSLNGTGKITIGDKNVITANNLVTDNASAGQITLAGENAVAVIKAHKFTNNGKSNIVAFATPGTNSTFLLQFQENYSGSTQYNTFEDLDIAATYADYDKVADKTTPNVTLIDKAHKKYGYQWSGDPATIASQAKLDLIASEESKGGQSATCIQSANNKLYVSYHTYGDKNFGGNIEVLSMTGNQLKVDANKAAENCDYNHLIVDGNSLYLAGSGKKSAGAFLGKVDINDGKLGDEVKLYAIDNKTKMDANCVAEFNGEHVVATTKGLTSFAKDFSFWSKAGAEGKHVVTANNKLYTLDVDGNVNVYDNNELETPVTYKVGAVVPKDNKAVMAVEETSGDIYVCKGENGVAKISSNGQVNDNFFTCPTFTKPEKTELAGKVKGRANGIAIGSDYIYVACGGYGLVVLDKETGKTVCHRKANAYKNDDCGSANYVAVENVNGEEYVYVAYGQNRVQVFKVTKTK
jgi:hypothetical protein